MIKRVPCQNALVLGLGQSGEWAAKLLQSEGCAVTVLDSADNAALRACATELGALGARALLGAERIPLDHFDLCVVSPGIPLYSPWLREVRGRGIPIRAEIELAWSRRKAPVLAVTGTNGKSTAVKFLVDCLQEAGLRARAGGNYGFPMCRGILEGLHVDWWVLEVSSFQLETVQCFRPDIGVLLNVQPDHLDRHGDMDRYLQEKLRLFAHMREGDTVIVPADMDMLKAHSLPPSSTKISFGQPGAGYRWENGRVLVPGRPSVDLRETYFNNPVLGAMASAAAGALDAVGCDLACMRAAARGFVPLPHRMQHVATQEGITFINDSKATNLAALMAALRMVPGPVRLIAGGRAKENNWTRAKELLVQKVSTVYLVGEAAGEMETQWNDAVTCYHCATLENALFMAWSNAEAGDTVLLSPACTSFDQCSSFEERGRRFTDAVGKGIQFEKATLPE